ncbi:MAG TPA: phage/plasmid primase, P4 family, partial [Acidimicrobiales bacterium]|nr:phage/plasmid primase, P4 family [Acidimicrobiales bacterium]
KWAKRSEEARSIAAMVKLARGIPGVVVEHRDLDRHPWLLNVQNGTIDLRTGELGDHDPDHLITTQAPVVYDPAATAPLWRQCLERWQPDPDVRRHLQRLVGSAATGVPVEVIAANVGGGANGKGKFYGALMHVLGPDYCAVPHKSLVVAQRHEQHDTVRARLFGVRMAVAAETEAGDLLDESKVKELTGGDLLEARRMNEDPWQFTPSHTLFLHTNHRPRVRGTDEGIWRRIQLIPWTVTIPEHERDLHLAAKLTAEAPGILNWITDGARQWHDQGFDVPDAIVRATAEYRTEEDHLGRFLAECCHLDPAASISAGDLRSLYERWCSDTGEDAMPPQALGRQLTNRGFDTRQVGRARTRTWFGLTDNEGGERL